MISEEEVRGLANLARLKLSDAEVKSLQKEFTSILDYVGQIESEGGDISLSPLQNVMRKDEPRAGEDPLSDTREALLAALPKREGDLNVVRKIIDK